MQTLGEVPWRDLIAVGGSAGSLAPLTKLLQGLPASCPACVLIVVHSSSESADNLARILSRTSRLPISIAAHNQPIARGVFVAPPDYHLLVTPGYLHVTLGPKENGFRPAIDPLFRTAAHAYGPRVIGVLLSGALDDGVDGLQEIKSRGGLTIVQNPNEADIPNLPRNAIEHVDVDHVLTAAAIAPVVTRETVLPRERDVVMGGDDHDDPQLPGGHTGIADMNSRIGPPSGLTCPDCGGALWQVAEGGPTRFQCHVGHRYSPESLVVRQDDRIEQALWTAVRALEERAELRGRMASQTEAAGLAAVAASLAEQAASAEMQASTIRELLARPGGRTSALDDAALELPARRKRPRQR